MCHPGEKSETCCGLIKETLYYFHSISYLIQCAQGYLTLSGIYSIFFWNFCISHAFQAFQISFRSKEYVTDSRFVLPHDYTIHQWQNQEVNKWPNTWTVLDGLTRFPEYRVGINYHRLHTICICLYVNQSNGNLTVHESQWHFCWSALHKKDETILE